MKEQINTPKLLTSTTSSAFMTPVTPGLVNNQKSEGFSTPQQDIKENAMEQAVNGNCMLYLIFPLFYFILV